jgi:hypothetical protein
MDTTKSLCLAVDDMRGFDGTCDECNCTTQLYAVCHVCVPFRAFCGRCNKADKVMHGLKDEKYKEERVQRIYVRRTKEGTYDRVSEYSEIIRKETAFARTNWRRSL